MAESSRIVVIVGIPGVGKSTLVKKMAGILAGHDRHVSVVSFGTIMLEEARKAGISDRDQLRKLPVSRQRELQSRAGRVISSMTEDIVIIDTHAFISTSAGFYPGLPEHVLKIIRPGFFVSVSARPEEIYNRRRRDGTRNRDLVSIDVIKKELSIQESMVSTCCVLSGSPMKSVLNTEGMADEIATEIIDSIGLLIR